VTATGERLVLARRALLLALVPSIVLGLGAGLGRLGLPLVTGLADRPHGPLLVLGFFGSVIALERAVALGASWALAAPAAGVLASAAIALGAPAGPWLAVLATLLTCAVNAAIVRRQPTAFTWLMLLGSLALFASAVLWSPLAGPRAPIHLSPLWLAFFVSTIVAERLELSRLAPRPRWAEPVLVALVLVHVLAALLTALRVEAVGDAAVATLGASFVALALWQLRFDLSRHTVRRPGLPRFVAVGVLAGSAWLLVTGLVLLGADLPQPGPRHDAALHATLVGFVLSMVMAHALIILPAVARVTLPFTPWLHAPMALLHASVALRVVGDLSSWPTVRVTGAALHAVALVLFVATALVARARAAPAPERSSPPHAA
jgi:hypothetical protein